jgi:hypothetical protein
MLAGALALAAVAVVPSASFAYYPYTVSEATGRTEINRYVSQGQWVNITADPARQIWSGLWFTGNNGPAGYGSANNQSPLPGAPAYSLLARIGSTYKYVGNGNGGFAAPTSGWLTLFINDDVPGNGSGYFGIEGLSVGSF